MKNSKLNLVQLLIVILLMPAAFLFNSPDAQAQNTFPATGNSGIGTMAPPFALSVEGETWGTAQVNVRASDAAAVGVTPQFRFEKSRGGLVGKTAVQNGDRIGAFMGAGYDGSQFQRSALCGFRIDGTVATKQVPTAFFIRTGNSSSNKPERFIVNSDGMVGIGTSNPQAILDVNGGTNGELRLSSVQYNIIKGTGFSAMRLIAESSGANGGGRIDMLPNSGGWKPGDVWIRSSKDDNNTSATHVGSIEFSHSNFNSGGTETVRRDMLIHGNDGTVQVDNRLRIGTQHVVCGPHADYKLAVDGKLVTKSLYIDLSCWADYVFTDDYVLTPLAQVEENIEAKGHLHNMPSEAAMIENGLDVSEITTLQQEKIEEIFLHLIRMEKEINSLKAENHSLKTQLSATQQ